MKIKIITVILSFFTMNIVLAHPGADDVLSKVNVLQENPSENLRVVSTAGIAGNGKTKELIVVSLGIIKIDGIEYNVDKMRSYEVVSNNFTSFFMLDCASKRYEDSPFINYRVEISNNDKLTYRYSSLSQGFDKNNLAVLGGTTVTYLDITISEKQ